MRKLVFRLMSLPTGSVTPNLDISTHLGARLHIVVNRAAILDVEDDPMSDSDLLTWYKSRYSGMGLGISLLKDAPDVPTVPQSVSNEVEAEPVVQEEIPVQEDQTIQEDQGEPLEKATVEAKVETPVAAGESKISRKTADELSYEELLAFAADHDIPIAKGRGRSESCVRKTVAEWMKEHD